jgi:predicted molibdopterin-dependent oxidoreductase YjgC
LSQTGLLQRIAGPSRPVLHFELDGRPCTAQQGDTVLTAVLTQSSRLRAADVSGQPRAGFCLMGACQDCWVMAADGRRLRACSTQLEDGMRLITEPPP